MNKTSSTFLSTLTQITMTAVVLLVSGIIAFTIYKQERYISYNDEITKERINIRSYLFEIKNIWNIGFEMIVPVEFENKYKSLIQNKSQMDIWTQALIGSQFDEIGHSTEITKAFELFQSKLLKNENWIYPVRLFIVSKIISTLTKTSYWEAANPKGLFPVSATDIGYEEWERDFKHLYGNRNLIQQLIDKGEDSRFIKGLRSFLNKNVDEAYAKSYAQIVLKNLQSFLVDIDNINTSTKLIQEKDYIVNTSYSAQFNPFWIIVFIVLSIIVGVITPLIAINYDIKFTPIIGTGILILTFISLVFSFIIFAKQTTSPRIDKKYEYVLFRRYKPLLNVLKEHLQSLSDYQILDLSFIYDVKLAGKKEGISNDKISEILIYLNLAEKYNSITNDFADHIKSNIRKEFSFSKLAPHGRGYYEFPNNIWFDQEKRTTYLKKVLDNKTDIGFNLKSSNWTRDLVWLPCGKWSGSVNQFTAHFDTIVRNITTLLEDKDYFMIIEELAKTNNKLQSIIANDWIIK